MAMWEDLSVELLSHIFSYLPLPSLTPCLLVSKQWHSAATTSTTTTSFSYLLTIPTRSLSSFTTFPPLPSSSSSLPLHFLPTFPSLRLAASTSSLLLFTLSTPFQLLLSNPFTRQFSLLPPLPSPRSSNPAIGLITSNSTPHSFRIFVAGGAIAESCAYQQTVDVFNSDTCEWRSEIMMVPLEFAVRLTVWTPHDSVYSAGSGVLYWMTSARVYSIVGYGGGRWREVKAPMAERLEWAGMIRRREGRVGVVGGLENGKGFIWELKEEEEEEEEWVVVGVVPERLKGRSVRCVGSEEEGEVYLIGEGEEGRVLVGREKEWGKIEWSWVDRGCCCFVGKGSGPIKAVMVKPCLSPSPVIERLKEIVECQRATTH